LHETVHLPFTHAGRPFGSEVEQTWPPSSWAQPPQLVAVLVVSTQAPLQTTWPAGQPLAQWYEPPSAEAVQTGVPPSQLTPHAPQLEEVVSWAQPFGPQSL
jgi:hypothetical protein